MSQALGASGLLLWGLGVQLSEGVVGLGLGLCALSVLPSLRSLPPGAAWAWMRRFAPLLAFVAWGLCVTLPRGPPFATGDLARQLDWLSLPLAAACWAALPDRLRGRVLLGWGGFLLLSCLAAGLQHFGLWPPLEWFEPLRWTRQTFYRVYEQVPGTSDRFMAGGLLFHRLKFAHVGGFAVLAAVALAIQGRGRVRAGGLCLAGVAALSVLWFPHARAGIAALLGGLGVMLAATRLNVKTAASIALLLVLVLGGALALQPSLRERLLGSGTTEGSGGRRYLLAAGLAAARAHPLTGTGVGRFSVADWASKDAPAYVQEHPGRAHNQLVSVAAEQGLPGLVLFLWMLVALGRALRGAPGRAFGQGALAFFVLLCLLHDPTHHTEVSLALMLSLGCALAGRAKQTPEGADLEGVVRGKATAGSFSPAAGPSHLDPGPFDSAPHPRPGGG